MKNVDFYIVGGYVRDMLMGVTPKDKDFVVVGADRQYMLDNGYNQVGADFPVFISRDGDEYALARKERSNGDGYVDFEFDVENLNPELLQKFVSMGYDPDTEYDVEELISVLQHINL